MVGIQILFCIDDQEVGLLLGSSDKRKGRQVLTLKGQVCHWLDWAVLPGKMAAAMLGCCHVVVLRHDGAGIGFVTSQASALATSYTLNI